MRVTIFIGILIIAAIFSGCTGKKEELPATAINAVEIKSFAFNPATITVPAGTTVTWTNSDSASHTITSATGNELESPELGNGQTFKHTFKGAGTYYYQCNIHPTMKGIVKVS